MTNEQKDMLKGLTINIKQLHLRYEDDYYSSECPYSFGLVIDVSIFHSHFICYVAEKSYFLLFVHLRRS